MDAFLKFRADRAFAEGMTAYRAGQPRHAPAHFCEHSGDWTRGWNVAWLAENITPVQAPSEKIEPAQPATA